MKLRSLFIVLFSVAVVAGTVITLDAFAANPREDSRIEEASEKEDTSAGKQDSFVCEAEGCMRTGVHTQALCPLPECTEAAVHVHDGTCYFAHSVDDGHAYHVCGIEGCTLAGEHTHNSCGVEGCALTEEHMHNSCGVEGCTLADEHTHNSCGVEGCARTDVHTHNSCGVEGCARTDGHTHNSCGVNGCNITEAHSHHNGNSGGSGHRSRHGGHH